LRTRVCLNHARHGLGGLLPLRLVARADAGRHVVAPDGGVVDALDLALRVPHPRRGLRQSGRELDHLGRTVFAQDAGHAGGVVVRGNPLNQDAADVEALAIRQTPTFFLNGKRLENFSADSLIADVRFAVENS